MISTKRDKTIRLAVAGVGNCASSLIEGICYYRQHPEDEHGLLFPVLGDEDEAFGLIKQNWATNPG
jgi:myo-inositol-1-phosphate synthase